MEVWEGNIFNHVYRSVSTFCPQVGRAGHATITHDALGTTIQTWHPHSPQPTLTSDIGTPGHGPFPQLLTSCGHHRRPVQTCLLRTPHPLSTSTDIWW